MRLSGVTPTVGPIPDTPLTTHPLGVILPTEFEPDWSGSIHDLDGKCKRLFTEAKQALAALSSGMEANNDTGEEEIALLQAKRSKMRAKPLVAVLMCQCLAWK